MATCEWKLLILNRIIALRRFAEPFQNLSNHFKNARADRACSQNTYFKANCMSRISPAVSSCSDCRSHMRETMRPRMGWNQALPGGMMLARRAELIERRRIVRGEIRRIDYY